MAHELTLVLNTPVEDLIPKMLAWNNEELLTRVEATLKQYDGITYDSSQISVAKADRAQLNAFCTALNDERIRIGKVYSAPYDRFKGEVDEVIKRVKGVVELIDGQVKGYEDEQRRRKLEEIKEYFNGVIGDFAEVIIYENIHNPKWLNASTSMASIKKDIDAIIANARTALIAIEALKSEDEATLKAFYFRSLDLSATLIENDRLKKEKERIAELSKATQAAEIKQEPIQAPEQAEPAPKKQILAFQVEATVEQLKALQAFLVENKIAYKAVKI